MFVFLIGASVVLFVLGVLCYRAHPMIFVLLVGIYSALSGLIVSAIVPWLLLMYLAIFAAWAVCRWFGRSWLQFSAVALLAIGGAWGVAIWEYMPKWRDVQVLARDYPIQHIGRRLAYENSNPRDSVNDENEEVDDETFRLATQIYEKAGEWETYGDFRAHSLAALEATHNNFVAAFVRQEGFGVGRMIRLPPSDEYIRMPEPPILALAPPPRISVSAGSEQSSKPGTPVEVGEVTRDWHTSSVVNFSNPDGFGYLVDRRSSETSAGRADGEGGTITARGFETHAFQSIPEGSPWGREWQLMRLELVSLLKHDPPAVYLSDSLPRMAELSSEDVPTRPLDECESIALERLRKGEVIVVRQGRNRVRMLGSLLATRECIRCHNVTRGQMLGAFSYEFMRKEPLPAPPDEPSETLPPLT